MPVRPACGSSCISSYLDRRPTESVQALHPDKRNSIPVSKGSIAHEDTDWRTGIGAAGSQPGKSLRTDARRSTHALLTAAAEVFAASGVDAPVHRITARAGVGAGALYRHFPQRSDLIAAVLRNKVDACAEAAEPLAAQFEPAEALTRLLRHFADFIGTKRGLGAALHSGDPPRVTGHLAMPAHDDGEGHAWRMVALLVDGLRYGAHPQGN